MKSVLANIMEMYTDTSTQKLFYMLSNARHGTHLLLAPHLYRIPNPQICDPSNSFHYTTREDPNGNVHKNEKRGDLVKNETVVLRMIYIKKHIKMFQRLHPPMVELAVL